MASVCSLLALERVSASLERIRECKLDLIQSEVRLVVLIKWSSQVLYTYLSMVIKQVFGRACKKTRGKKGRKRKNQNERVIRHEQSHLKFRPVRSLK